MSENPPAPTAIATERLDLRAVHLDDLDALHEINRDPAVWRHQPAGRHAELAQTRDWIERAAARWPEGLSYWTARLRGTQTVVGVGGVQAQGRGHWNLYYRLAPHTGAGATPPSCPGRRSPRPTGSSPNCRSSPGSTGTTPDRARWRAGSG